MKPDNQRGSWLRLQLVRLMQCREQGGVSQAAIQRWCKRGASGDREPRASVLVGPVFQFDIYRTPRFRVFNMQKYHVLFHYDL